MKKKSWAEPIIALIIIGILLTFIIVCDLELKSMINKNRRNQENFVRFRKGEEIELRVEKLGKEIRSLKKRIWKTEELILDPKIESLTKEINELEQRIEKLEEKLKQRKRNSLWWLNPFNW